MYERFQLDNIEITTEREEWFTLFFNGGFDSLGKSEIYFQFFELFIDKGVENWEKGYSITRESILFWEINSGLRPVITLSPEIQLVDVDGDGVAEIIK